jgi:Annexin
MDGAGTNDGTLIRIIVSRADLDLGNIKRAYEKQFNKTLYSAVSVSIVTLFISQFSLYLLMPPERGVWRLQEGIVGLDRRSIIICKPDI